MLSSLFWKKPEEAQMTPHQAQRQKQIDSLKAQHRKVMEVTPDSFYRVPFNVGAQTFFLDITLGAMFPRDPPVLRMTPRGTHPWVDGAGTIISPKMAAFSMHSDLGRLISELIEEFQRNPPLIPRDFPPSETAAGGFPPAYRTFPVPPVSIPRRSDSPSFPAFNPPARSFEPLWQSVNDNFPEVQNMDATQLQALLDNNDDQILREKITTTPVIASLRDEAKRIMESNNRLAVANLTRRPLLEQKKSILFDKYTIAGEKRQEFDDLQRKHESTLRQFDPRELQKEIRNAVDLAEAESDSVADDFLSGKLDLDSFLPAFFEKRKLYHGRKKTEELFGKQVGSNGFYL